LQGGERHLVDDDEPQCIAGHVDTLKVTACRKETGAHVGAKLIEEHLLGHVVLRQQRDARTEVVAQRIDRLVERTPTGEEHERRTARHGDEFADACLHPIGAGGVVGYRQIAGQIQKRAAGVVERARHLHDVVDGETEAVGQRRWNRRTREDGGGVRPHGAEHVIDPQRRRSESCGVATLGHETHHVAAHLQHLLDPRRESVDGGLGPQHLGLGLVGTRQLVLHQLRLGQCRAQGSDDVVRHLLAETSAGMHGERLVEILRGRRQGVGHLLARHRLARGLGRVCQQPRRQHDGGGVADHVFEFVHFVEDDHVVIREKLALLLQVEAVEAEVDDHHVRVACPFAGQFREAGFAELALRRARALVGGKAHLAPGGVVEGKRHVGGVSGLGLFAPGDECIHLAPHVAGRTRQVELVLAGLYF